MKKTRTLAAGVLTAAFLFTLAPAASAAPSGAGSDVATTTGFVDGTRDFWCNNFNIWCP